MSIIDIIKSWFCKEPEENTVQVTEDEKEQRKKYCWMHKGNKTVFVEYSKQEQYIAMGYTRGRAKKSRKK